MIALSSLMKYRRLPTVAVVLLKDAGSDRLIGIEFAKQFLSIFRVCCLTLGMRYRLSVSDSIFLNIGWFVVRELFVPTETGGQSKNTNSFV